MSQEVKIKGKDQKSNTIMESTGPTMEITWETRLSAGTPGFGFLLQQITTNLIPKTPH